MENPVAGAGALEVGDLQIGILSDVYLGGVWGAALDGFARMAESLGDQPSADSARAIRARAARTLEARLWNPALGQYAFALLQDGSVNPNLTSWPATAMAFAVFDTTNGARMAARLASSNIMTDWGARPLSATSPLFDPLHYNNGAVWPFVTGFVSLAQYRYHNAPAGFFALQAIARTGFDQSLGHNPEVISAPSVQAARYGGSTPVLRDVDGAHAAASRIAWHRCRCAEWAGDARTASAADVGLGERGQRAGRAGHDVVHAPSDAWRDDAGGTATRVRSLTAGARLLAGAPVRARTTDGGVATTTTPGDLHATIVRRSPTPSR
jgi:hypothetical protein